MKRTLIIALLTLLSATSALRAQDTIDTNYYRYDNHFLMGGTPGAPNYETGEWMNGCPNGTGFAGLGCRLANGDTLRGGYFGVDVVAGWFPYMYYGLSKDQDIYGIAIPLDSIENFTVGDSLVVTLCRISEDHTRIIHLDSIVIKGGEIGKRRWMEIPINRQALTFSATDFVPYDNCIDTVMYRQLLEFYFDEPKHIDEPYLFWIAREAVDNGSAFRISYVDGSGRCYLAYFSGECVAGPMMSVWDYFFPIVSPLPEWEVPSMEQVIPYPVGADIPDPGNPDDPDNPGDPQNPDNPDDPDDPDNPGGDEGIGDVDGGLQSAVSLRPNPSSGMTTVSCAEAICELTVCDMAGRVVLRKAACGATATFDTSTFRKGVYLVKVTTTRGTVTKKLVVEP